MRLLVDDFQTSREGRKRDFKALYIIAFEGFRTEKQYFCGIKDYRNIAGLRNDVLLSVLQRTAIYSGWSDPLKLLELVNSFCGSMKRQSYSKQIVLEFATETYLGYNQDTDTLITFVNEADDTLKEYTDKDGFITDINGAVEKCENIIEKYSDVRMQINLPDIPEWKGNEKVYVVIDRDLETHSIDKMRSFISECNKHGYQPHITNPCFEFWLMMHFDECILVDRDKLLKNEKDENGKRFTETELDTILRNIGSGEGYDKRNMDPGRFIHRIKDAIKNNKMYCHDIGKINNEIGSTLCCLFEELLK